MLDSSVCRAHGLPAVPYAVARDGGAVTFHAERRGEETDSWTGRIQGDVIEGTYVSTKTGAAPVTIAFRGRAR